MGTFFQPEKAISKISLTLTTFAKLRHKSCIVVPMWIVGLENCDSQPFKLSQKFYQLILFRNLIICQTDCQENCLQMLPHRLIEQFLKLFGSLILDQIHVLRSHQMNGLVGNDLHNLRIHHIHHNQKIEGIV